MRGHVDPREAIPAGDSRLLLRLLKYLRPYGLRVALTMALLVVSTVSGIVMPAFYQVGIDYYIRSDPSSTSRHRWLEPYLSSDPVTGLGYLAAILVGILLLSFCASAAYNALVMITGQKVVYDVREEIFTHLQRLPIAYYDRHSVGTLVTRATNDVEQLAELFGDGVVTILADLLTIAGIMTALFFYDWRLALLMMVVLPAIAVIGAVYRRFSRAAYRRMRRAVARINAFLNEYLSGMAVVQLFNREAAAAAEFRTIGGQFLTAGKDLLAAGAIFSPAVELVGALAVLAVITLGGHRQLESDIELGVIVAFVMWTHRLLRPVFDLSARIGLVQSALASVERIFALLDTPVAVTTSTTGLAVLSEVKRIEFQNIWFSYQDEAPQDEDWVLKDVSFSISPGETVAVVGRTGAGKTSLISLLLRFYDAQRGRILLDGTDIREIDPRELRRQFGVVFQDPFLFAGTIANNVRLGREFVSDEDLAYALRCARLDRFVATLPGGLDHEVCDGAASLSTGQKQLLSIARAIAHDPRILVLDEATSVVDTETELLIQTALAGVLTGRTTLVIAHRLSTVCRADQILVMHRGRLVEQGTHVELLARCGIYHRLYLLQYSDQEAGVMIGMEEGSVPGTVR